jgi:hypothetical protein
MAILHDGQQLQKGGAPLDSDDGRFGLFFQNDGNVVVYYKPTWRPLWSTGTPSVDIVQVEMQADGNFVLYRPGRNAYWASGTAGHSGATLQMQNDSNLVIYDSNHTPLWAIGIRDPALVQGQTGPIVRIEDFDMGNRKEAHATASLYRNGVLTLEARVATHHPTEGLRADLLALIYDAQGNAIWVSPVYQCQTVCSTWDPSCPSKWSTTFTDQMPAAVGQHGAGIDLLAGNRASLRSLQDTWIGIVKGSTAVASEIMAAAQTLSPGVVALFG